MAERNRTADFTTDTSTPTYSMPSAASPNIQLAATTPRFQSQAGLDLGRALQQFGASTAQAASVAKSLANKNAAAGLSILEGERIATQLKFRYDEKNFEMDIATDKGTVNLRDYTLESIGIRMEANGGNVGEAVRDTTLELISSQLPEDASDLEKSAYMRRAFKPVYDSMLKYYNDDVLAPHKEHIQNAWAVQFADVSGQNNKPISAAEIWKQSKSASQGYWSRDEVPQIMVDIAKEHTDDGNYDLAIAQINLIPDQDKYKTLKDDALKRVSKVRLREVIPQLGEQLDSLNSGAIYAGFPIMSDDLAKAASDIASDPNLSASERGQVIDAIESWAVNSTLPMITRDMVLDQIDNTVEAFRPGGRSDPEYTKMKSRIPGEDEMRAKRKAQREALNDKATDLISQHILRRKTEDPPPNDQVLHAQLEEVDPDQAATWRLQYEARLDKDLKAADKRDQDKQYVDLSMKLSNIADLAERRTYFRNNIYGEGGYHDGVNLNNEQFDTLRKMAGIGTDSEGIDFSAYGADWESLIETGRMEYAAAADGQWTRGNGGGHWTWTEREQPDGFEATWNRLERQMRDDITRLTNDEEFRSEFRNAPDIATKRSLARGLYDQLFIKWIGPPESAIDRLNRQIQSKRTTEEQEEAFLSQPWPQRELGNRYADYLKPDGTRVQQGLLLIEGIVFRADAVEEATKEYIPKEQPKKDDGK